MFEKIAYDKGYNKDAHAFAMCFWLGFVGYIYVAAMPKLTLEEIKPMNNTEHNELVIKNFTNEVVNDIDYSKADAIYDEAIRKMTEADQNNSLELYREALNISRTILNYKGANDIASYCIIRMQQQQK